MASPGLQPSAVQLLGRERECAVIDRALADAGDGAGGALVVRGEPGIGKSALLDYARQRAAPMAVLSAAGVEAESDLAFAGLHELLRPVLGYLGELPDIQSRALAGALGIAPSTHADRLLISAAVLGVLAAAAEDRPTLCVVDDAQWLDRPSADALVFTARRLRAEHLTMVFGAREGEATRFEAAGLAVSCLPGWRISLLPWFWRAGHAGRRPGCGTGCSPRPRGIRWRCWSWRAGCRMSSCRAWSRCRRRFR